MSIRVSANWGNRELTIETGLMAKQADGAVLVTYGGTAVLTAVVADKTPQSNLDFLPLTVDYREKTYAAGKIPGGFFKRESKPRDKETLTSRLIDRPIRPLFPKTYFKETQVISMVLSVDQKNDPDILAMIGAPAALLISEIPFTTFLGCIRVGCIDGRFIMNPTYQELEHSSLDMIVAGTEDAVAMVECFARQVSESVVLDGIEFAHREMQPLFALQRELVERIKPAKLLVAVPEIDETLLQRVKQVATPLIDDIYQATSKMDRKKRTDAITAAVIDAFAAEGEDVVKQVRELLEKVMKQEIRKRIIETGVRVDRRTPDEIRQITSSVSILPMTHGSALFTRGETQCLAIVTLGTSSDYQRIDDLEGESKKTFMLHYNFPHFSVGEVKPIRGPGRREIGHGMLAEKAILPVIPGHEVFPYTLRIVSEILESNGSSSMATVCGSSLALMDAGVPITNCVGGVAIGLIKEGERVAILTDIMGAEDAIGDMDLKVAGTREGITAIQMDMKIKGITREILQMALEKARIGRNSIIDRMNETLVSHRSEISPNAPRIIRLKIHPDKIRDVIGPGGKIIRGIIEKTGAEINIENDGSIEIASPNMEKAQQAERLILELIEDAQVGKIYLGKVKRVEPYGAFIGILPGVDGLLHISQIADYHITTIESELKEGDDVLVKLIEIDKFGRLKLSRKAALKESPDTTLENITRTERPETIGDAADPDAMDMPATDGAEETAPRTSPPPRRDDRRPPRSREGDNRGGSRRPSGRDDRRPRPGGPSRPNRNS